MFTEYIFAMLSGVSRVMALGPVTMTCTFRVRIKVEGGFILICNHGNRPDKEKNKTPCRLTPTIKQVKNSSLMEIHFNGYVPYTEYYKPLTHIHPPETTYTHLSPHTPTEIHTQ